MARRRPLRRGDEAADGTDRWIEWGGTRVWVVGHTPGGAPFGLTEEEMLRIEESTGCYGPGWLRARNILEQVFCKDGPVDIGRVQRVGRGLSSEAYAAYVELSPDPGGRSGPCVVLLPFEDEADPERDDGVLRHARVLAMLGGRELPFRVPELVAIVREAHGLALVLQHLRGVELDLRAGRTGSLKPWEVVGQIAAALHTCSLPADLCPGHATRRDHARAHIAKLAGLTKEPVLAEAHAWALANLPPDEPASVLHGDLLGQNILVSPEEAPALVDWEAAMWGDPAYDLAIVTRGARRPFQVGGGLARLLDAYQRHGGRPVTAREIHLHELCLIAGWYRSALDRRRGGQPPDFYRDQLAGVLRRAMAPRTSPTPSGMPPLPR